MNLELYTINAGNFMLDGGAMFGVVPKSLWEKVYPADERNLCNLSLRCLLVKTGARLVLIDTGLGNKQSEKFFSYYFLNGADTLESSLAAAGFRKDDITDVLLTHLHFDHAGGAVARNPENQSLEPAFPRARYWVSHDQWQWAIDPNRRERASFLPENFLPLAAAGVLEFLQSEGEWLPGIEVRFFRGHTNGLVVPLITFRGQKLVFVSDLVPTAAHVPVSWVCAYDTRPLLSFQERETFLEEACKKGYILFFEHDLYHECCRLEHGKKGVKVREYCELANLLS